MGRRTESFPLFAQQFGRALRTMGGKEYAIIIDHVGNVERHGLPDAREHWTLDARERRNNGERDPDLIPVRSCQQCYGVYEAFYKTCPYCGYVWVPAERNTPEQVDGDLEELTPEILAVMRDEIKIVDMPVNMYKDKLIQDKLTGVILNTNVKRHRLRQEAQQVLRDTIALWAGYQRHYGIPQDQWNTRFYFKFGIDKLSAQALGVKDAEDLNQRVQGDLK